MLWRIPKCSRQERRREIYGLVRRILWWVGTGCLLLLLSGGAYAERPVIVSAVLAEQNDLVGALRLPSGMIRVWFWSPIQGEVRVLTGGVSSGAYRIVPGSSPACILGPGTPISEDEERDAGSWHVWLDEGAPRLVPFLRGNMLLPPRQYMELWTRPLLVVKKGRVIVRTESPIADYSLWDLRTGERLAGHPCTVFTRALRRAWGPFGENQQVFAVQESYHDWRSEFGVGSDFLRILDVETMQELGRLFAGGGILDCFEGAEERTLVLLTCPHEESGAERLTKVKYPRERGDVMIPHVLHVKEFDRIEEDSDNWRHLTWRKNLKFWTTLQPRTLKISRSPSSDDDRVVVVPLGEGNPARQMKKDILVNSSATLVVAMEGRTGFRVLEVAFPEVETLGEYEIHFDQTTGELALRCESVVVAHQ